MQPVIIFITTANKKEAQRIAAGLVKNKLVACVNIIPGIESFFRWQGKVDHAKELLLVAKSKKSQLSKIIKAVRKLHSYTVPEIIALPVAGGYKPYLEWMNESIG